MRRRLLLAALLAALALGARGGPGSPSALGLTGIGIVALLLLDATLVPATGAPAAALATLVAGGGTFLLPALAAPAGDVLGRFLLAALVLALTGGGRFGVTRAAGLGVLVGVAARLDAGDAALALLPLVRLAATDSGTRRERLAASGTLVVTLLAVALPFGGPTNPWRHGTLGRPAPLELLFAPPNGLLHASPVLWLGFLGLLAFPPRARGGGGVGATGEGRRSQERSGALTRRVAVERLALLAPLAVLLLLPPAWNEPPRFAAALPLLCLGLGRSLAAFAALAARRPGVPLAAGALVLTVWNLLFMEQYRRQLIPRDDTVAFADVAMHNAGIATELFGSPLAAPASWAFAWQEGLPAWRYEGLAGRALFDRPASPHGVVDVGRDLRDDAIYLAEGWSVRHPCGEEGQARCRDVTGRARVLLPLDRPERLELVVRARGRGELALRLNGSPAGRLPLGSALVALRLRGALPLRRGINQLELEALGGFARVDALELRRAASRP